MSTANETHALVVGGGIAGLTTALTLHRAGIAVTVFESVADIRALGVGINLLPHSTRILCDLGLQDRLEETAILTAELRYHAKDGKKIWVEPRGLEAGYPWPQYSIHRGALQMLLLDAVKERLGADRVITDHHFDAVERNDEHGVTAHFVRKSTGESQGAYNGDLLIGADGIGSKVRTLFYPDQGPPKFSGLMLWRGVVEMDPFLGGRSMVMAGHSALKVVFYPISAEAASRGRSLINWIAQLSVGAGYVPNPEDWNRRGVQADFAPQFKDWDFGWIDLPRVFAETKEIFEFPMIDRDTIPQWTFGRVTLLGDAAHPMYPNGSNGAAQGILDAQVIAESLAGAASVDAGLAAYEDARRETTAQIVLDNRKTGPERVLQMVDERCDGACADVHTCVPTQELQDIADRYKRVAGFDKATVNG